MQGLTLPLHQIASSSSVCPAADASRPQQTVVLHALAAGLVFMSLGRPGAHWGNAGRVLMQQLINLQHVLSLSLRLIWGTNKQ